MVRCLFRYGGWVLIMTLFIGCTREIVKQDAYLQSEKELSRTIAVQSTSPSYKDPSYPLKVYTNIEMLRNYSVVTRYKKVPPPWLQFIFWGGAISSAGAGYLVGNPMIESGRVVLGEDIMLSGIASGLVMVGGYYFFTLKTYQETRPCEKKKIESSPLVSQNVTVNGPSGLGLTWFGQISSDGYLRIPWNFLERAAQSSASENRSLRFEISSSGISPTSFNLSSSQILSTVETRNNASTLLLTAKENIGTGDISAAIDKLKRIEVMVPGSDIAQEVAKFRKKELPRAALKAASSVLKAKLANLLSTMEIIEALYCADNLSADNALVVMSQGFGYGMDGYAAYIQLSAWQKLFAVMYFADLVAGNVDAGAALLVRASVYKEYLRCSDATAGKLGWIEPMSIFE